MARAHVGEIQAQRVLAPLVRSLTPAGGSWPSNLVAAIQGWRLSRALAGRSFEVDRHQLIAALKQELRRDVLISTQRPAGRQERLRYEMHTLPSELATDWNSTLFAAWNAAIYVNQIEDGAPGYCVTTGAYLDATQEVLQKPWRSLFQR